MREAGERGLEIRDGKIDEGEKLDLGGGKWGTGGKWAGGGGKWEMATSCPPPHNSDKIFNLLNGLLKNKKNSSHHNYEHFD